MCLVHCNPRYAFVSTAGDGVFADAAVAAPGAAAASESPGFFLAPFFLAALLGFMAEWTSS